MRQANDRKTPEAAGEIPLSARSGCFHVSILPIAIGRLPKESAGRVETTALPRAAFAPRYRLGALFHNGEFLGELVPAARPEADDGSWSVVENGEVLP